MAFQKTSNQRFTVLRYALILSVIFFNLTTVFGQEKNEKKSDKFNAQSFYALSDWEFYKAVCNPNDSSYRMVYEWSKEQGARIKVIQRLDSLLTKINDGMMSRNYAFFSSGFTEIKAFEEKLASDDVKKQEVRRHLNYQMDSLYVVGIKCLFLKCNLGYGFGKDENYKQYLSFVRDYSNLQRMYITFQAYENDTDASDRSSSHVSTFELKEQLQAIAAVKMASS